ncbi:MAG TPA: IS1595 family transposase [Nitrospiraceae bacterium]|nr:IS1595 family transposase [Nitrospiraceae bacterium]
MGVTRCKLSKKQQRRLLEFFVLEVTARSAADLLGLHSNTTALFYRKIREVIVVQLDAAFPEPGLFEVDESYFGGTRKGKRGRGAAGKVPVFGILKRGGQMYTQIIDNTKTATLLPIIRQNIQPASVVYIDSYRSFNALDISEFKHYRINHSELFADRHNHINGIENFWNQAKRVLRQYNGIPAKSFYSFLKECEFRFNYGSTKQQLSTLRQWSNL